MKKVTRIYINKCILCPNFKLRISSLGVLFLLISFLFLSCKSTENNNETLSEYDNTHILPKNYIERIDIDFTPNYPEINANKNLENGNISDTDITIANHYSEEATNNETVFKPSADYITDVIDNNNIENNSYLTENNFINYNKYNRNTETLQITPDELLNKSYKISNDTVKSEKNFYNSIVEYIFIDGKIYDVILSKNYVTDIRLESGEEINGNIAIGDGAYWSIETVSTIEHDEKIVHILIRAEYNETETNIIIPTNRRTYYLHLTTTNDFPMIGIRFKYPVNRNILTNISHSSPAISTSATLNLTTIDATKLNFSYVIEENEYFWSPKTVFSDGKSTYFQFDPTFRDIFGAPALYYKNNDEISLINYTILGNLYITKTIIDSTSSFLFIKGKESIEITRSIL